MIVRNSLSLSRKILLGIGGVAVGTTIVLAVAEEGSRPAASLPATEEKHAQESRGARVLAASTPSSPWKRKLVGGYRLEYPFARGALAVARWDAAGNPKTIYVVGHMNTHEIVEFTLPAPGKGSDPNQWPVVKPTRTIPPWWPVEQENVVAVYANDLAWYQDKLWVAPRGFYDLRNAADLTLYPWSPTRGPQPPETISGTPERVFSGFVKRRPGEPPYLGGGGYESGTTAPGLVSAGPSLAVRVGGSRAIQALEYPGYYETPGANLEHWNLRAPRDPDYRAGGDSWVAWKPRNGEGRWASDQIFGGGLVLPEGVHYWALHGVGMTDYNLQFRDCPTDTFTEFGKNVVYVYGREFETDPSKRPTLRGVREFPLFDRKPRLCGGSHTVAGRELGPDGTVYLMVRNAWASDLYRTDPVLTIWH